MALCLGTAAVLLFLAYYGAVGVERLMDAHRIKTDRKKIEAGVVGFYKPKPGMVPNPMMRYERNTGCWCGSGAKAKRCCLPGVKQVVTVQEAEFLNAYLKDVGMK